MSRHGVRRAAALAAQVAGAAPRVARPAVRLQALGEGGHVISLTAKEAAVMQAGELVRPFASVGTCTGKGTAYAGLACGEKKALVHGASAKGNDGPTLCNACYHKMKRSHNVRGTCTGCLGANIYTCWTPYTTKSIRIYIWFTISPTKSWWIILKPV